MKDWATDQIIVGVIFIFLVICAFGFYAGYRIGFDSAIQNVDDIANRRVVALTQDLYKTISDYEARYGRYP